MLKRIDTVENIPDFLEGVKQGNERLMGFGHRVYKKLRPRARIIRKYLDDVFEVRGKSPLLESPQSSRSARSTTTTSHRASSTPTSLLLGLIYEALGLPVAMFPVMFAIGRTSDGSPSGRRWSRTTSRRSPAHARSTPATATSTMCRSSSAPRARASRR